MVWGLAKAGIFSTIRCKKLELSTSLSKHETPAFAKRLLATVFFSLLKYQYVFYFLVVIKKDINSLKYLESSL
jgi:hypothetical protein